MTDLVLYKIVSEEPKIFEHRVYLRDNLSNFLVTLSLEGLIDIEVDVSNEIIEDFTVLVDELLVGLKQRVLWLFFALEEVEDHDPSELRADVGEVLHEGETSELLVSGEPYLVVLGFLLPEKRNTAG